MKHSRTSSLSFSMKSPEKWEAEKKWVMRRSRSLGDKQKTDVVSMPRPTTIAQWMGGLDQSRRMLFSGSLKWGRVLCTYSSFIILRIWRAWLFIRRLSRSPFSRECATARQKARPIVVSPSLTLEGSILMMTQNSQRLLSKSSLPSQRRACVCVCRTPLRWLIDWSRFLHPVLQSPSVCHMVKVACVRECGNVRFRSQVQAREYFTRPCLFCFNVSLSLINTYNLALEALRRIQPTHKKFNPQRVDDSGIWCASFVRRRWRIASVFYVF